jgi:hypothetical protein
VWPGQPTHESSHFISRWSVEVDLRGQLSGQVDSFLQHAIRLALRENPHRTNRAIGVLVGCSDYVVRHVREELEAAGEIDWYAARGVSVGGMVTPRSAPPTLLHHMPSSWVYAIGPVGGGLTKIGHTGHVRKRLAALQYHSPVRLTILWQAHGGEKDEVRLHKAFAAQRAWGEWFDLGDDPVRAIKAALEE